MTCSTGGEAGLVIYQYMEPACLPQCAQHLQAVGKAPCTCKARPNATARVAQHQHQQQACKTLYLACNLPHSAPGRRQGQPSWEHRLSQRHCCSAAALLTTQISMQGQEDARHCRRCAAHCTCCLQWLVDRLMPARKHTKVQKQPYGVICHVKRCMPPGTSGLGAALVDRPHTR